MGITILFAKQCRLLLQMFLLEGLELRAQDRGSVMELLYQHLADTVRVLLCESPDLCDAHESGKNQVCYEEQLHFVVDIHVERQYVERNPDEPLEAVEEPRPEHAQDSKPILLHVDVFFAQRMK
eukprot:CAMPEP_0117566288 /NCGR_PEP_ID=MMETSP0784-20121206/57015_1 /TAXON_ID=39447 /ORGANISM="" /LENGTH=123 /DNA_ID=CAMNT_0005364125 /DNA_START=16 /DNA_END=387 /DNA_ORIENTATION=-